MCLVFIFCVHCWVNLLSLWFKSVFGLIFVDLLRWVYLETMSLAENVLLFGLFELILTNIFVF